MTWTLFWPLASYLYSTVLYDKHTMPDLKARLNTLNPVINEICRVSGTAGASIGVLHDNEVVFAEGFGFRDVEAQLAPDQDTIYYLSSLSKAFTSAATGILVEQGKLTWTTPIRDVLPNFKQKDRVVMEQSTLVDWLSHRTGLAPKNWLWPAEMSQPALKREETLPMVAYLEKLYDFRKRYQYSNWGYAIADHVIEEVGGKSWGNVLNAEVIEPLGMKRTVTDHNTSLDNVAKSYIALSDGSPHNIPRPFPESGKIMAGATAVQSNVRDLLKFYKALMAAAEDQTASSRTHTPGNPLSQVETILKAHIPMDEKPSDAERFYALGWARTHLPASMGVIGLNPTYVPAMPVVGKGIDGKRLCIWHQGSNNAILSSVFLLPDTNSAVVVLTNSMANNDAADWLGQMVLETVLDNPEPNDYLELARASAAESVARWPRMRETLDKERTPKTSVRPLDAYCGTYFNAIGDYRIEIYTKAQGQLQICFQGAHEFPYDLSHEEYDKFSWLITRNQAAKYGRFPSTRAKFYVVHFVFSGNDSSATELIWSNDGDVPGQGEAFRRGNNAHHSL